ncbi:hypothetical protein [Crassaminicella indica]|uniref:Uncharacterized protein n=1 Tax=Crassaminicella indica TaxID=2855394 RepID=A0ABX8R8Z8_9CLOT|nr:hypothetical protein [Crassaminicella indica]QXM05502.1 hypothetical protein KVH43_08940 [Crassaminicella indica]
MMLWDDQNHGYEAKRYYKVDGVHATIKPDGTLTTNKSGQSYTFTATFYNAMAPWDSKTASIRITLS